MPKLSGAELANLYAQCNNNDAGMVYLMKKLMVRHLSRVHQMAVRTIAIQMHMKQAAVREMLEEQR
jgi:hypothetical protein